MSALDKAREQGTDTPREPRPAIRTESALTETSRASLDRHECYEHCFLHKIRANNTYHDVRLDQAYRYYYYCVAVCASLGNDKKKAYSLQYVV